MTGQPAARADAVSPPATEKASGKLLAEKTATGPRGTLQRRTVRPPSAWSIMASRKEPSSITSARKRSCPVVRASSPVSRGSAPSAVSSSANVIRSTEAASIRLAIARSQAARVLGGGLPTLCAVRGRRARDRNLLGRGLVRAWLQRLTMSGVVRGDGGCSVTARRPGDEVRAVELNRKHEDRGVPVSPGRTDGGESRLRCPWQRKRPSNSGQRKGGFRAGGCYRRHWLDEPPRRPAICLRR